MRGSALRVLIAPANESESSLYEDDGESLNYRKGDFMKREFYQIRDGQNATITVSKPEGTYRPAARDLMLETWVDHEPKNISMKVGNEASDSTSLPHLDANELAHSSRGWSFADGLLTVKENDSFKEMKFVIEH
jgi:hypothetical protein